MSKNENMCGGKVGKTIKEAVSPFCEIPRMYF